MAAGASSTSAQANPSPFPMSNHAPAAMAQSPPTKQGLKKWWASFKNNPKTEPPAPAPSHIFGVPLRKSITYANVAISLIDAEGRSYIYGYVPIIVAKCGVYLKEQATETQGIFRLSGSEKRIKELKTIFDSPDRYGKGLDWSGYNVHDASNVLRRYLGELPEPIIPLDLYERFREPLRGVQAHQQQRSIMDTHQPVEVAPPDFDMGRAIATYQRLITELPPLNRQLLLYILDLLAVFASKAEINLMTPSNLSAIFQPCMLNHPDHDMSPHDYILNQNVLIFLIENQDHFLIGMTGTAADEQALQQVQQGGTPPAAPSSPGRSKTTARRSASIASAGADSLRKAGVRRNASTASRHSRQSNGTASPSSPALPTTASGVHRSNTVPSKKSPALAAARLNKSPLTPTTPTRMNAHEVSTPQVVTPSPASKPAESTAPAVTGLVPGGVGAGGHSQERLLDPELRAEATTPVRERTMSSLFQKSPTSDTEKRPPNKLKKKRLPGSTNPSAQSSTQSLHNAPVAESPVAAEQLPDAAEHATSPTPRPKQSASSIRSRSSVNEQSDLDGADHAASGTDQAEKKSRWPFKRHKHEPSGLGVHLPGSKKTLGSVGGADVSSTSVNSGTAATKTTTGETTIVGSDTALPVGDAGGEKDEKKVGPIDWLKIKMREAKDEKREREGKERTKSPPASDRGSTSHLPFRGRSVDLRRDEEQQPAAPTDASSTLPESAPVPTMHPVATTIPVSDATPSGPIASEPAQAASTATAPPEELASAHPVTEPSGPTADAAPQAPSTATDTKSEPEPEPAANVHPPA